MDIQTAINMAVMAVSRENMLDIKTKQEIIEALAEVEGKILDMEDDNDTI